MREIYSLVNQVNWLITFDNLKKGTFNKPAKIVAVLYSEE
jgi:hypothetical protein